MFPLFTKIIVASCCLLCLAACKTGHGERPVPEIPPVDTSITVENAYVPLFLDSVYVSTYASQRRLNDVEAAELAGFYSSRNYQYAWFDSVGVTPQALHFLNRLNAFNSDLPRDSVAILPLVDSLRPIYLTDSVNATPSDTARLLIEVALTHQFFRFVHGAYGANQTLDIKELGWFIPAKKINAAEVLDSVLAQRDDEFRRYMPVHPLYQQLRQFLQQYVAIEQQGIWDTLFISASRLASKDSGANVFRLKQKLHLLGDLADSPKDSMYNDSTKAAVKLFRSRMGFAQDTIADAKTIAALNEPIEKYIRQLYVNLERARWIPKPPPGRYIKVNIPAFMLYAFNNNELELAMSVVVGKPATNTVIFNGNMTTVALSPYWNVPYSIVKNEMGRSDAYFARRNMEIVGRYSDGLPMVRERPGPNNSLGRVKFLFPNSYNIYLHDTPAKSLFNRSERAFSHGCIRVSRPPDLAYWVLSRNEAWDTAAIDAAMRGRTEQQVKVKDPIPVFIGYFTAFVDRYGRLQLRDDIYGHDAALEEKLFAQPVAEEAL